MLFNIDSGSQYLNEYLEKIELKSHRVSDISYNCFIHIYYLKPRVRDINFKVAGVTICMFCIREPCNTAMDAIRPIYSLSI